MLEPTPEQEKPAVISSPEEWTFLSRMDQVGYLICGPDRISKALKESNKRCFLHTDRLNSRQVDEVP